MTEDETWTQFRDLEVNVRLRNAIELFLMKAPAETGPGVQLAPTGAFPGEDATAEIEIIGPTRRDRAR